MEKFFKNLDVTYTGVFFMFAGLSHFFYTDLLASVVPAIFPMKVLLVYLTGIAEIILGALFLFESFRKIAALAMTFLVTVFLSVHIEMLLDYKVYVDAYKLDLITDQPVVFFIARVFVQLLLILWMFRSWYKAKSEL
ncbi:MAG: DoxX family membrane protein [Candidatus Caenarcaniphilales bacterium]|nr:DoxX family membrane protein [Candidatus Caenarcaniphilales bacterium]